MVNVNSAAKQLNDSGYPFQLAVEHEVKKSYQSHLWRPVVGEHRWQHVKTTQEGFVDIVLERAHGVLPNFYMIIECKRVTGGRWVFLTKHDQDQTADAHLLEEDTITRDSSGLRWVKRGCRPLSLTSSFCVVPGQKDTHGPSLERISSMLLDSVEAVAFQRPDSSAARAEKWVAHYPAIVTNAVIVVCKCDPAQVDIATGKLGKSAGEFISVPFVRFRKAFATTWRTDKTPMNLREMSRENQRTIFVIHAPSLPDFLAQWNLED